MPLSISRYNTLIMTVLFPISSIADVRDVLRGKDVTWQFRRMKRGPGLSKSRSGGNVKEARKATAAKGPHKHGPAVAERRGCSV